MSMAAFIKLEDSPMFQKQVRSVEQNTDELRDRCQKLYKGCKKYMEVLGEAHNGDIIFAESLEAFGGGLDDPLSVSLGGPIITKFISALRELATYKELIRSQVMPEKLKDTLFCWRGRNAHKDINTSEDMESSMNLVGDVEKDKS